MPILRYIGGYLGVGVLFTGERLYSLNKRCFEIDKERNALKLKLENNEIKLRDAVQKSSELISEKYDIVGNINLLQFGVILWPFMVQYYILSRAIDLYDSFYWYVNEKIIKFLTKDN